METLFENQNTESSEKKLYDPFIHTDVDPRVTAMRKSTEDKMYIVLYYNTEYEEYKHAVFYGRYDAYFGIKNILDSESIDLSESTVLVETVGIDPNTKNPRRYLIHPDDASNIIDFCKQMEAFFGENSYSLAEYMTGEDEEKINEKSLRHEIEVQQSENNDMPETLKKKVEVSDSSIDDRERFSFILNGGEIPGSGGNGNTQAPDLFMDKEAIKNGGKYFINPAVMDGSIESKEI